VIEKEQFAASTIGAFGSPTASAAECRHLKADDAEEGEPQDTGRRAFGQRGPQKSRPKRIAMATSEVQPDHERQRLAVTENNIRSAVDDEDEREHPRNRSA